MADVDVVIVSHNSADHLGKALSALPRWARIVVVDNASEDESLAVAEAGGARCLANRENVGFAIACNQAATLGTTSYILFLNPDAVIEESDLATLVQAMETDSRLAAVTPKLNFAAGGPQRVTWPVPSLAGAWAEALGISRWLGGVRRAQGFAIGACLLVRRAAFEAIGGFDTRYWLYGEDADLCRRFQKAGWAIGSIDESTAIHVGGASANSDSTLVFEHFNRGSERVVADAEGTWALVGFRLANLFGSLVRSVMPGSVNRRKLHRRRMARLGRVLLHSPWGIGMESPASASPEHAVVVCSLEAWDEVWRRNQFFVEGLLGRDPLLRVLFVEPPFDYLLKLRSGRPTGRKRGIRSARGDGRLLLFQPAKYLPRMLGEAADRSLRRQVRLASRRVGFDEPTLWINDASYARLMQESDWATVYDITDDWLHSSMPDRARARLRGNETMLLEGAGAVVACSTDLVQSRAEKRDDVQLIGNGVDIEHFVRPAERPQDLPDPPVAVYVGTLHEDRLDVDLVEELASEKPDLTVVLVGPNCLSEASVRRLRRRHNVRLTGTRPHADIPSYMQHADVIIVPHVVTPFTESLDPIKGYECQVVGRPTVATPVAGFRGLASPVRVVPRGALLRGGSQGAGECGAAIS